MQASDVRKGAVLLYKKDLYVVTDFAHRTPGNLRAFVQITLKNIKNGKIIQDRFASTENLERVSLDPKSCQYLYHDSEGYHFMDMEDYHTFSLSEVTLGDKRFYLKDNMEIKIDFYEGQPLELELPKVVTLKVTEAPPGLKGDSVSNTMKTAVCETGLKIQVPLFVNEGIEIKVNTETGEYVSRA
jgi:elongation factor P